jgi:hypothetical protein
MTADYRGLSYEQASREGLRLVRQAAETGAWHKILEPLTALREIMALMVRRPPSQEDDGA